MPTITGLTATRMAELEAATIVGGHIVGNDLMLEAHDGTLTNAGNVRGPAGPPGEDGTDGTGGGGGGGGPSTAPTVSYTPTVSADWDVVPTTVQQALDMLAAWKTMVDQYNFLVIINAGDPIPSWVRSSPQTAVMVRPPA